MGWHSGFEKTCICNTIRPLTTQYGDSLHQFESCTAHHPKPLKPLGFKGFLLPKSGFSLIFSLMKSPDRNGLNKLLHTLCAILLHLLRDVSVNI